MRRRRQRLRIGRLLLLSLTTFLLAAVVNKAAAAEAETGPIVTNYNLIEKAARSSLDIYGYDDDDDDEEEEEDASVWFRVARRRSNGVVRSAVLFQETETECFATFRGTRDQGLAWIADMMDLKKSFVGVFRNPKKGCRVVREYKNRSKKAYNYRDDLEELLLIGCAGKQLVFAGHNVGGAVAVIAALTAAKKQKSTSNIWIITFGQPPVLMPAKYTTTSVWNQGAWLPNDFCPYLLDYDRYVSFVNAEPSSSLVREGGISIGIYYDYVTFLHVLLYGIMIARRVYDDSEGLLQGRGGEDFLGCILQAVNQTEQVLQGSDKGNLGIQTGSFYVLSPSSLPNNVSYQKEGLTHQAVQVQMLVGEALIRKNDTAAWCCASSSSGTAANDEQHCLQDSLHSMEIYYNKTQALEQTTSEFGFQSMPTATLIANATAVTVVPFRVLVWRLAAVVENVTTMASPALQSAAMAFSVSRGFVARVVVFDKPAAQAMSIVARATTMES